jgi:ribosomal protein S27E
MIKSNTSQPKISEQLAEIRGTATELGWIQSKGEKSLSEQLEEVKAIAKEFGLVESRGAGGISDTVAIELEKMRINHELELERMKDDRSRKDKEWELTVRRWDDEKELKRQEIQGKLAVEKDRNEFLSSGIEKLGGVIVRATAAGAEAGIGGSANKISSQVIEAGEGEFGETMCPACKNTIAIAKDASSAICPGCNTIYPVRRIPKEPEKAPDEVTEQASSD